MRRGRLVIGIALLAAVSAVSIWCADWRFWKRYLTRPQTANELSVAWYQPHSAVTGAYRPLQRATALRAHQFDPAKDIAAEYETTAFLVAVGNKIVFEEYSGDTSATTPHLTFSFHKTVTALLTGLAISDGYIASADAPVGTYIRRWANDDRGKPTLRRVMQMSGGYSQPSREGGPFSQSARFSYSSDIVEATLHGGLDESDQPPFEYSDRSAQIVGLALQSALPVPYENYLSDRLWKPLHASDAAVTKADENGPAITYCCLMAAAEDWIKIGMLLRDRGRFDGRQIVPAKWIDEMTKPAHSNPNFGLFMWLGSPFNSERHYTSASPASVKSITPFAAQDVIFMDGAGGQRVYVSRDLDLVVVRLGAYRADWDDTRLFNAVANAIKNTP